MEQLLSPSKLVLNHQACPSPASSREPDLHRIIAPSPLLTQRHGGSSVDQDLRSLEDQMRRCTRIEPSRLQPPGRTGDLVLRLLHRHLVSLVVLLALLSAVAALGG